MRKNKITSDTIVSLSAIVIAVVSIIIAIWQGIETRKHNRLSVQPKLDISYSLDYKDSLAQLSITNNGLGPAIIEDATATIDSTLFRISEINEYLDFQEQIGLKGIPTTYEILKKGASIISKEIKPVLIVEMKHLEKLNLNPVSLFNDVKVNVIYRSLYEEEFVVTSEK